MLILEFVCVSDPSISVWNSVFNNSKVIHVDLEWILLFIYILSIDVTYALERCMPITSQLWAYAVDMLDRIFLVIPCKIGKCWLCHCSKVSKMLNCLIRIQFSKTYPGDYNFNHRPYIEYRICVLIIIHHLDTCSRLVVKLSSYYVLNWVLTI